MLYEDLLMVACAVLVPLTATVAIAVLWRGSRGDEDSRTT
jgi:hypothetical protein